MWLRAHVTRSIRQALALLTRKLISEDDELELLNIYRETQRLRAVLETLQADKSVEAPVKTNIVRLRVSHSIGHFARRVALAFAIQATVL